MAPTDPRIIEADVVIFGGGISGLTAAQELSERNFKVAVIDPDYTGESPQLPAESEENPGLGGVARSQWGFLSNDPRTLDSFQRPFAVAGPMTSVTPPLGTETIQLDYSYDGRAVLGAASDYCTGEPRGDFPSALGPLFDAVNSGRYPGTLHVSVSLSMKPTTVAQLAAIRIAFDAAVEACDLTPDQKRQVRATLVDDVDHYNEVKNSSPDPMKAGLTALLTGMGRIDLKDKLFPSLFERSGVRAAVLSAFGAAVGAQRPFDVLAYPRLFDRQPPGTAAVSLNLVALPGEHGFRFFPSFYRHVFDLMKRIPLTEPFATDEGKYPRKGRATVFDNLVSVDKVGYVGDGTRQSLQFARRAPASMAEARELLKGVIRKFGLSQSDLEQISRGILKYATSSRQRREEQYEDRSWYDFLDGDRLSARGRFLMETTPGTLLALSGSQGDARTQGTIGLQCFGDQLGKGGQTDMLLNGPTDTAWFGPWYRYLRLQQVDFYRGRLTGFDTVDGQITPVAEILPRKGANDEPKSAVFSLPKGDSGRPVYFILALPLVEAHELAQQFVARAGQDAEAVDFRTLCAFPRLAVGEQLRDRLSDPYPEGPLRHMSGVQFFFNQDIRLWQAHTQYLDAPAGLTAIAQPQFWSASRDILSGFRSVLSVDIGTWIQPTKNGKAVPGTSKDGASYGWGKTRQELAELVWAQIAAGHRADFRSDDWIQPPAPFLYHVDDNLVFAPADHPVLVGNRTPFLVNETGRYRARPGGEGAPEGRPDDRVRIRYRVAAGRFILAGTHMQTYTRITSMEAACESARHAVNALLEKVGYRGEGCAIWDPEDFEPGDLSSLKQLDAELCARGLPHMLDIIP